MEVGWGDGYLASHTKDHVVKEHKHLIDLGADVAGDWDKANPKPIKKVRIGSEVDRVSKDIQSEAKHGHSKEL